MSRTVASVPVVDGELKSGNGLATWSLILGIAAFVSFLALVIGLALNQPWLMDNGNGSWLILPFLALFGGGTAALLGAFGWRDVRQARTVDGLRGAQVGLVLGGIAASAMILSGIGLVVIFLIMMLAFPNGA